MVANNAGEEKIETNANGKMEIIYLMIIFASFHVCFCPTKQYLLWPPKWAKIPKKVHFLRKQCHTACLKD